VNDVSLREAGDAALLLQLPGGIDAGINARAIAIARSIGMRGLRGIRDVVPTFRSVAVHFDPVSADIDEVSDALRDASASAPLQVAGRRHEIPVSYGGGDGPDLDEVATRAGMAPSEVIRRHAAVAYRVFMLGFQPGFAYLGLIDPSIAAPRRATPRLHIAAGSVGIAGRQTAIYPSASPGGWQIIGRALEPVFDVVSAAPRFAPGDTVVFRSVPPTSAPSPDGFRDEPGQPGSEGRRTPYQDARSLTVLRPGLFTTIQDGGVWGRQAEGFPVSGAMDTASHALANALVDNPPNAAALEVTIAGPELRLEQRTTIAVAGADLSATLDFESIPLSRPVTARAGAVLRFGPRVSGARAYVAFEGGLRLERRWPVTQVAAGQVLALNQVGKDQHRRRVPAGLAMPSGGARLRVIRGPQDDQLPSGAFDALLRNRFAVSPHSNRIGYRLRDATVPAASGEMISDATFAGAIQVPPSGEPILLMADRQTTGGYPQVATVIAADLPVAGQLAPGDWVEFVETTRAEAVAALRAQEAKSDDAR
jgi:KipI family sensor histidine kinase inhibitor